jgi:hypothetical protein
MTNSDVRMRVGDKLIYWEEGKCVIFDDTHGGRVRRPMPARAARCSFSSVAAA